MIRYTRAERLAQITNLRERRLTDRETAAALGLTYSGVRNILSDPDGSKQRERRERYRGTCEDCGSKTDGSSGYNAPKVCGPCIAVRQTHHGAARYNAGCRCEICLTAHRMNKRRWRIRVRGNPPSHGTLNGYVNYGCRCDSCSSAHKEEMRSERYKRVAARYRERKRKATA